MDTFEGILEFVAVAEAGGFSAAAKRLGSSTSHVSRQVSRLEKRLGSALLARTTRSVKLTSVGQQYYEQCKGLLHGLQQANEQISGEQIELTGTLRVSAAGAFAEQFVVPALLEFAEQQAQLSIDLNFNSQAVNFVEDGIDFAIRYGRLEDSGLVARKLIDRKLVVVASPSYLQQHGTPQHPSQLKQHQCLVANSEYWLFDDGGELVQVRVSGRWRSNNANAIVQACKAGLGIAYMPRSSFLNEIKAGDLQPILEPYWTKRLTSWIVYQNRKFLPLRARLAIEHLLMTFADWQE
ncbi:MAG: LysR family transcriptional regulator [Chromatiales bacterium]|nr:LysR family transcriptional regulator [Chromatiales bacterium]